MFRIHVHCIRIQKTPESETLTWNGFIIACMYALCRVLCSPGWFLQPKSIETTPFVLCVQSQFVAASRDLGSDWMILNKYCSLIGRFQPLTAVWLVNFKLSDYYNYYSLIGLFHSLFCDWMTSSSYFSLIGWLQALTALWFDDFKLLLISDWRTLRSYDYLILIEWFLSKSSLIGWFLSKSSLIGWFVSKCSLIGWFLSKFSLIGWFVSKCSLIGWFLSKFSLIGRFSHLAFVLLTHSLQLEFCRNLHSDLAKK